MSKLSIALVALAVASASPATSQSPRGRAMRVAPIAAVRLVPPPSRDTEDPADSLYRLARRAMADEGYSRAAQLFGNLVKRYPQSD